MLDTGQFRDRQLGDRLEVAHPLTPATQEHRGHNTSIHSHNGTTIFRRPTSFLEFTIAALLLCNWSVHTDPTSFFDFAQDFGCGLPLRSPAKRLTSASLRTFARSSNAPKRLNLCFQDFTCQLIWQHRFSGISRGSLIVS